MDDRQQPLSGRKAQAARNDQTILDAARAVFMQDPTAPISEVAKLANVGISALYRRYPGKEVLLQTLCVNGLHGCIAIAEHALATEDDPWDAFRSFIRGIIDADVHSLTVRLACTFTPTEELHRLADEANKLSGRLFRRARSAGVLRADLHLNDVAMLLEQVTAIRLGDAERTQTLRHRYLALQLDALRAEAAGSKLPGPPPTSAELGQRWIPTSKPAGR